MLDLDRSALVKLVVVGLGVLASGTVCWWRLVRSLEGLPVHWPVAQGLTLG